MAQTKYDMAVWHNSEHPATTYAFPLSAPRSLDDLKYPKLGDVTWEYKGTLPKGAPVDKKQHVAGSRYRYTIAGLKGVDTADWAIED